MLHNHPYHPKLSPLGYLEFVCEIEIVLYTNAEMLMFRLKTNMMKKVNVV